MKNLFFVLSLVLCFVSLAAQDHHCGTVDYAISLRAEDSTNANTMAAAKRAEELFEADPANFTTRGAVYVIPVVFHVMHNGEAVGTGTNISDAQIFSQMDVINLDYRKLNSDTGLVPSYWKSIAADCEIEFCLASTDPSGNPTTGITRTNMGTGVSFNDATHKPATVWDRSKYLNIWVTQISGGLLGYTTPPGGPANRDGVVLGAAYVGSGGTASPPYDKGRTATHEIGHWLGLDHTWGDDGGACSGSDGVSDTPNSADANYGCPSSPHITCSNGPNGDMFQNYMDYTNDACMFMFTNGQKNKMRAVLQTSRASILTASVCTPGLAIFPFSGQVVDATTGAGVANAKVFFEGTTKVEVTTDAAGNFDIGSLHSGSYNVYAGKWGYGENFFLNNGTISSSTAAFTIPIYNYHYYDDFALNYNWTTGGTATAGQWVRDYPVGTTSGGQNANPGVDAANDYGTKCFVTANGTAGGAANASDIDGGTVTLTSPTFDATIFADPYIRYERWFYDASANDDHFRVIISNGSLQTELENIAFSGSENNWSTQMFHIADFITPTNTMSITVEASDAGSPSTVEAGLDKFEVFDGANGISGLKSTEGQSTIFPNPANSLINIAYGAGINGDISIQILNELGQQMQLDQDNAHVGKTHQLDISSLPAGVYYVQLQGKDASQRLKFLKF